MELPRMELPAFRDSYYHGREIFVTGGTGFVGTALVTKLILSTSCAKLTVLTRGGTCRFWKHVDASLPTSISQALRQSGRIQVLDGDLTQHHFGLSQETYTLIQEASIIVHAASSINLAQSLSRMAQSIVYPSIQLAKLAATSPNLDRFVYISTAYSNAHLHLQHDLVDTEVEEAIYDLGEGHAKQELEELRSTGSTHAFETSNFPFPYAYAKHLTERLIQAEFEDVGRASHLLIARPSVIGPALTEPFPYYERQGSVPATAMIAALVLCTSPSMTFSSPFDDPGTQSTIDEVPVDIVVNRIIVHTAAGSTGCVHAVAGQDGRRTFDDFWKHAMEFRVLPWVPRVSWRNLDWASDRVHPIPRFFKVWGTSYLFSQAKTDTIWDRGMTDADRLSFPLYLRSPKDLQDLVARGKAVREQVRWMLGRLQVPKVFAGILVKDLGKRSSERPKIVSGTQTGAAPMRWLRSVFGWIYTFAKSSN